MYLTTLILVLGISTMTTYFSHKGPQGILMVLMLETLLSSLIYVLMHSNMTLSYFLFMMFLGGLIVVFTYICILSPYEVLNLSPTLMSFMKTSSLLLILILISEEWFLSLELTNMEMTYNTWTHTQHIFHLDYIMMYFFMAMYLLLSMLFIVNMLKTYEGPLRFYFK